MGRHVPGPAAGQVRGTSGADVDPGRDRAAEGRALGRVSQPARYERERFAGGGIRRGISLVRFPVRTPADSRLYFVRLRRVARRDARIGARALEVPPSNLPDVPRVRARLLARIHRARRIGLGRAAFERGALFELHLRFEFEVFAAARERLRARAAPRFGVDVRAC